MDDGHSPYHYRHHEAEDEIIKLNNYNTPLASTSSRGLCQDFNREQAKSSNKKTKIEITQSLEDIINAHYAKTKTKSETGLEKTTKSKTETASKCCKVKQGKSSETKKRKQRKSPRQQENQDEDSESFEPDYSDFPRSKKSVSKKKTQAKKTNYPKSSKSSSDCSDPPPSCSKNVCTTKKNLKRHKEDDTSEESDKECEKVKRRRKVGSISHRKSSHSHQRCSKKRSRSSSSSSSSSSDCDCEMRRELPRRKNKRTLFERFFAHLGLIRTKSRAQSCRHKRHEHTERERKHRKVEFCDKHQRSPSQSPCPRCRHSHSASCHDHDRKRKSIKHEPKESSNSCCQKDNNGGWIWKCLFGPSKSRAKSSDKREDGCSRCQKLKAESSTRRKPEKRSGSNHICPVIVHRKDGHELRYMYDTEHLNSLGRAQDQKIFDFSNFNSPSVLNFQEPRLNCNSDPRPPSRSCCGEQSDKEEIDDPECPCAYCPFQGGDDLDLSNVKVSPVCADLIKDYVSTELGQMLEETLGGVEETLQEEERQFWGEYIHSCKCPMCKNSGLSCELHR